MYRQRLNMPSRRIYIKWYYVIPIVVSIFISILQVFKMFGQEEAATTSASNQQSKDVTIMVSSSDNTLSSSNNNNERRRKIAWLMSFPNSGTSYTLAHVQSTSKNIFGTNYPQEIKKNTPIIPIFDSTKSKMTGPFWITNPMNKGKDEYLPDEYVLTKTHCTCYHQSCWKITLQEFQTYCQKSNVRRSPSYSINDVQKAIHLIRDPFDNIISRVHNYVASHISTHGAKANESDNEHFHRICKQRYRYSIRGKFKIKSLFNDDDDDDDTTTMNVTTATKQHLLQVLDNVPCRDDFFNYVTWHNMAFRMTEAMGIDTLLFHYESYDGNQIQFQNASNILLNFLNYPRRAEPIPFRRKDYSNNYFTIEQKQAIQMLLKKVASKKTWSTIKRYF